MAKSSRASTVKANNQRLKRNVFGPVEAARLERLSAKLLETASQPKPEAGAEEMKIVDGQDEAAAAANGAAAETMAEDGESPSNPGLSTRSRLTDVVAMGVEPAKSSSKSNPKKRIEKRRKYNKIVFPSFKDKKNKTKRRS